VIDENGHEKKVFCFSLVWFGFFQEGMPALSFV